MDNTQRPYGFELIMDLHNCDVSTFNRKSLDAYFEKLRDCDFLTLPAYSEDHAWHLFVIRLVSQRLAITRNEFISKLMDMGIGTSVHFIPLLIMPYYRKRYGYQTEDFPVAYSNYNYSNYT